MHYPIGCDVFEGAAPLMVHFTKSINESNLVWEWDFGDGGISTEDNPANTFLAAGFYPVVVRSYVWVNGEKLNSGYWDTSITVTATLHPVVMAIGFISPGTAAMIKQSLKSGSVMVSRKMK